MYEARGRRDAMKGHHARNRPYGTSNAINRLCSPWGLGFGLLCVCGGFLAGLGLSAYFTAPHGRLPQAFTERGLFVPNATPLSDPGRKTRRDAKRLKPDFEPGSAVAVGGLRDAPGNSDPTGSHVGGSSPGGEPGASAVSDEDGDTPGEHRAASDGRAGGVGAGSVPDGGGGADAEPGNTGRGGGGAVAGEADAEPGNTGRGGGSGGGGERRRGGDSKGAGSGDGRGGDTERGGGVDSKSKGRGSGGGDGEGGGEGEEEESGERDAEDSADAGEAGSVPDDGGTGGHGRDAEEEQDSGGPSDEVPRAAVLAEGWLLSKAEDILSRARYPEVEFEPTGGPIERIAPLEDDTEPENDKYRVVLTVDCQTYARWQILVNHWWYTKLKAENPGSAMGGYTRVLHCAEPDDIMHMVPTIRVDPLPKDYIAGYPPLNRPWAFVQWLARATFPERYVFMTEPDHIFLAPPPLLATPNRPVAYPFFYMACGADSMRQYCEDRRFNERGVPVEDIQPIGNSPVIISREMLREVVPRWDRLMRAIHEDEAASEGFGWVKEMYAFTLALANHPDGPPAVTLARCLMSQPPLDSKVMIDTQAVNGPVVCQVDKSKRHVKIPILHLTYDQLFDKDGKWVNMDEDGDLADVAWRFDKRDFWDDFPPLPLELPPEGTPESTVAMIERINQAGMSPELWPWWQANLA
eukprot:jgi/Ulvmu1/515/UM001_0523.1